MEPKLKDEKALKAKLSELVNWDQLFVAGSDADPVEGVYDEKRKVFQVRRIDEGTIPK